MIVDDLDELCVDSFGEDLVRLEIGADLPVLRSVQAPGMELLQPVRRHKAALRQFPEYRPVSGVG